MNSAHLITDDWGPTITVQPKHGHQDTGLISYVMSGTGAETK